MRNCITIDDWKDWAMVRTRSGSRWDYKSPLFIYEDKFDKNPNSFLEVARKTSDLLLFTGNSVFDKDFTNSPDLADIVRGKLNQKDYYEADYVFGQKSFIPLRDNHFYESVKNFILGKSATQPFKFTTQTLTNEFSRELSKVAADNAAKAVMNVAFDSMQQQGFSAAEGMSYKSINTKAPLNKVLEILNPQEQIEYLIQAILLDMDQRYDFSQIKNLALDNRFDIRSCFGGVEVEYGEIVPKHYNPAQVRWLANKRITSFEDPAVVAVGHHNFLTIEDALVKHGAGLYKAHGIQGLKSAVNKLYDPEGFKYNPDYNYYSNGYNTIEELHPFVEEDGTVRTKSVTWGEHDWAGMFYPLVRMGGAYRTGLIEHKFYWKMVKTKRFMLKVDGKIVSSDVFLKKIKGDWARKHEVDIIEVPKDYKTSGSEQTVELPIPKMYQATRLGHSVLIDVGEYEYAVPTKGKEMGWPIVANISYDKSLAKVGEVLCRRVNVIYQRIDEILAQMGHSRAIILDEAQEGDPVSFLYNIKRTGIARYNSTKAQGGSIMAQRHLQIIDLGENAAEVERLLNLAGLFQTLYNNMVGASEQAQGVYQKYSGFNQQQQNLENQSILLARQFKEINDFMNDLLQRCADVAKIYYADDEVRSFMIGKEEKVILKSMKEMSMADLQIKLESGLDLQQKKQKIEQAAAQVLSGAGVDFLEPLLDVFLQDNITEARALLRQSIQDLKVLEKTNEQRSMEALQQQNELLAQRNQLEMAKEQERTKRAIEVQKLKNDDKEDDRIHQGELQEYNTEANRENMLIGDMMQQNNQNT